jgi:hypothetical protein
MMKIVPALVLLLGSHLASAATAPNPLKGSPAAASQAVTEFLQGRYKAPNEPVTAMATLAASAKSLTVQAHFRDMVCTLTVDKNADASNLGWVVQQHQCGGTLR